MKRYPSPSEVEKWQLVFVHLKGNSRQRRKVMRRMIRMSPNPWGCRHQKPEDLD